MSNPRVVLSLAVVGVVVATASALAQNKPAAPQATEAAEAPSESSLTVNALQIGSEPNLEIEGIDINVASNGIVYSYYVFHGHEHYVIVSYD